MPHLLKPYPRSDTVALTAGSFIMLGGGLVGGFSLREWSSLLGVVCLAGLLWRALAYLPEMSHLARALSTALGLQLAAGALAQYLLARDLGAMPPGITPPSNTLGISLLIASRVFLLLVIVAWPCFLNRWEWSRSDTPVS